MKSIKISWIALIIIFAIPAIFFWRFFIQGKIPLPGDFVLGVYHPWIDHNWGYPSGVPVKNPIMADVVSFTYPMQTYAISQMKQGIAPLWNPMILTGAPLLANFQSAPFAITNLVYLVLSLPVGWGLRIYLQHALIILFTYLLLRHWKLSKYSSIAGGVFFAFSGFNMIWSQWNAHALTASFIPLIILYTDKFLQTREVKYLGILGFCITLQVFSGYPQVVIYTCGALALFLLVNFFFQKRMFFPICLITLVIMGGFLASSVQTLPAFELLKSSQRSVEPHPFEWAFLPYKKIITFIAPDYFGNHATGNWWGPQDYTSNTGFVGVVALMMSTIGFFAMKNKRIRVFFGCLALFSLLFSFPTIFSITLWKSGFLGFQAASAHRALVLFNFAIAVLAAFGLERLKDPLDKKVLIASILLPLGVLVQFALLSASLFQSHQEVALRNLITPSIVFASVSILILIKKAFLKNHRLFVVFAVILSLFELFRFGWKFTPFISANLVFPETPLLTYLKNEPELGRTTGAHVVPINLRMNYGIESVEGYDAVYPEITSNFLTALNGGDKFGRYGFVNDDTARLLSLINTKYLISLSPPQDSSRYKKVPINEPSIQLYEDTEALPRSTFFYDWQVKDKNEVLDTLSAKDFPYNKKLVITTRPSIEASTSDDSSTVSYSEYKSNYSKINVKTNKPGLLFTSDLFYPGWHAYIDGKETSILNTDFAFRSVEVSAGEHIVEYKYTPLSYQYGVYISLATSFGLLLLALSKKKLKQYN